MARLLDTYIIVDNRAGPNPDEIPDHAQVKTLSNHLQALDQAGKLSAGLPPRFR